MAWLSALLMSWLVPPQPAIPIPAPSNLKAVEANDPQAAPKLRPAALEQPLPIRAAPAILLPLPPISAPQAARSESQPPVETPPLPAPIAPAADPIPEAALATPRPAMALDLVPAAGSVASDRVAPPLPVFTFHAQLQPAAPPRDPAPALPPFATNAVPENATAAESLSTAAPHGVPSAIDRRSAQPVSPETERVPEAERPMDRRDPEPPSHDLGAKPAGRTTEFPASPLRPVSRMAEPALSDPNPQRRETSPERAQMPSIRHAAPASQPAPSEPPIGPRQPENPRLVSQPQEFEPAIEKATLRPATGGSELQLLLRPEHLGRVAVRLIERGGLVEVAVRTDNHALKNLLAETLPSLVDGMHRQGFQISRVAPGEGDSPLGWWTAEEQAGRGGRERHPQRRPARPGQPAQAFALEGDLS